MAQPELKQVLPHQFSHHHNSDQISQAKWREVQRAVAYLRWIPWIESIWVTGGLAIGNVQADDDIDFLIVTKQDVYGLAAHWFLWSAVAKEITPAPSSGKTAKR